MKKFIKIITIAVICNITLMACKSDRINISGEWTRPVADNEIGVIGTEHLSLNNDSSMIIVNDLSLMHKDSVFDCSMQFTTSVKGKWMIKDKSLNLIYDASTFRLDTIVGGSKLYATKANAADSVIIMMKSDLIRSLSDYYKTVYETIQTDGPLTLNMVAANADTMSAFYGDSFVTWTRQHP